MYKIEFIEAKNGSKTCKINNLFLHSAYNPQAESERFVQSLKTDFNPSVIFIIEPALSYAAKYLKEKFVNKKIICIRFVKDFSEYDKEFNKSFYFDSKKTDIFERDIFENFNEKELCASFFIQWLPSQKIFSDEIKLLSQSLKNILERAKSSLVTESYFSKRWFKNSLIFNNNIKKTGILSKLHLPIVICASGPSLDSSIPFLKKYRNHFFLLSASSSISVLLKNDLIPDLAISTDGGFWAKNHLIFNYKKFHFPIALTVESAFPKKLVENMTVIPLLFKDGPASELSERIFNKTGIKYLYAERNGTVSGTMLKLAESITDSNIFACGLDLESGKGKQHAEPNRNELFNQKSYYRLKNSETANTSSRMKSLSLDIYRRWFSNLTETETKRFFRLSDFYKYEHKLGKIQDVDFSFFEKEIYETKKNIIKEQKLIKNSEIDSEKKALIKNEIKKFLQEKENDENFTYQIFPSDEVYMKKLINNDEINLMKKKIEKRKKEFFQSLYRITGNSDDL